MGNENHKVVLAERPRGEIVPGKTFSRKTDPVPSADSLKDGQILVENIYLGLDPAMRGWLNGTLSCHPPRCFPSGIRCELEANGSIRSRRCTS